MYWWAEKSNTWLRITYLQVLRTEYCLLNKIEAINRKDELKIIKSTQEFIKNR